MMKAIADAELEKDIPEIVIQNGIMDTEGIKTISKLKSKIYWLLKRSCKYYQVCHGRRC